MSETPSDWEKKLSEWKKTIPFYKRLFYTIVGYPPMFKALPDQTWKNWESRFDAPEYDWKQHTGVSGPPDHKS